MNYYPFHLGDYTAHTAHLDLLEDLAYRRMLDAYYLREAPLPISVEEVARLIRMRQHADIIASVLREFFTETEDGWRHVRCDEEIERMQDKQAKARASAAASVSARRAKAEHVLNDCLTDAERTFNDRSTDVELPTPTPTPISSSLRSEEKRSSRSSPVQRPVDVSDEVWQSFKAVRKTKKAAITDLVILGIRREAVKAGLSLDQALTVCCERGWASFKADWINQNAPRAGPKQTANSALFASMTHMHQSPQQESHHGRTINATPRLD